MLQGQLPPVTLERTAWSSYLGAAGLVLAAFGLAAFVWRWLIPPPVGDWWQPSVSTGFFFILIGSSLFWQQSPRQTRASWYGGKLLAVLAGIVVLVGAALTLIEPSVGGRVIGLKSPFSLIGGLLAMLSLVTLGLPGRGSATLSWLSAVGILSVALFLLTDYLYGVGIPAYEPAYRIITIPTSFAFAVLGAALLLANPDAAPLRALRSRDLGGFISRRLLPAALILPILLLWLLWVGVHRDVIGLGMGYSLITAVLIVSLCAVIVYQALTLDRLAEQGRRAVLETEAEHLRRMQQAIEAAELYIWEVDPESGHVYHSDNYLAELGYEPEQASSQLAWWSGIIDPDDFERVRTGWRRMLAGTQALFQTELRVRRKQGDVRWMHLRTKAMVRDSETAARSVVGVLMDVTERHQLAEQLEDTQARLKLAMDIASVGYWEKDLVTGSVYYSPEWKRMLGYADHELANKREEWIARLHPDDRHTVLEQLEMLDPEVANDSQVEFRLAHKQGGYRWMASRAVVARDKNGVPVRLHGVHMDITERKANERRVRRVLQHDPLTGLPNRALIREFSEQLLAGARRQDQLVAVLFIDLDRFKPINDTYGHAAGDVVLKDLAARLRNSVRKADLVGRLGGDEFLVVLADVGAEAAVNRVAQLCLARLSQPYRVRDLELHTTASIGISLFPRDGQDIDTLIRHADTAMYEAKRLGRHQFQFYRADLDAAQAEAR